MNLHDLLATWDGTHRENRFNRVVILLLVVVNIALAVTVNQTDRTVVLVPPVLDGQVTLARNAASQEVKDAWALFVAELLGNVTPLNAEVLTKALDPLLAPALRQDVLHVLDSQIGEIKREKISLSFQPRSVSRDAGTDTLYVTGNHITSGPAAQPVAIERTYAIRIGFHSYRPVITYLDVYPGPPRTSDSKPTGTPLP
ncbi:TraE/TraK family type IV conjugative transfer system protein [Lamprocystis purpurea]|jgi:conjugal transfer pilus assembly protein TraE|uniref:TraE/TraK family type IV conjugative transfer system protein n=1 Tax=Lamprocystis purpurea TaxID=61598 RepID=UPI00037DCB19|nr:TraE/TraK family type IV conjugative transfer system protein [Lamprocystis purpurea]